MRLSSKALSQKSRTSGSALIDFAIAVHHSASVVSLLNLPDGVTSPSGSKHRKNVGTA